MSNISKKRVHLYICLILLLGAGYATTTRLTLTARQMQILGNDSFQAFAQEIPAKYLWIFKGRDSKIPDKNKYEPEEYKILLLRHLETSISNRIMYRKNCLSNLEKYHNEDPNNGWYDLAKARTRIYLARQDLKKGTKEYKEYLARPKPKEKPVEPDDIWGDDEDGQDIKSLSLMDLAMNDVHTALSREVCRDRKDQLQQIKFDVLSNSKGTEYAKYANKKIALNEYTFFGNSMQCDRIIAGIYEYCDILILEKKYKKAGKLLDYVCPLLVVQYKNMYYDTELARSFENLISTLETLQVKYNQIGRKRISDRIKSELIPTQKNMDEKWHGKSRETAKAALKYRNLIEMHSDGYQLYTSYYLDIKREDLTPSRMLLYMIRDNLSVSILIIALYVTVLYLFINYLFLYYNNRKNRAGAISLTGIVLPSVICIVPSFTIWFLLTSIPAISGYSFNGEYNAVGILFQATFLFWTALALPMVIARILAARKCRAQNANIPLYDIKLFKVIFAVVTVWLLTGAFAPVVWPEIRKEYVRLVNNSEYVGVMMIVLIPAFAIISTVAINVIVSFLYKRFNEYKFYVSMYIIPMLAFSVIFYCLVVCPYLDRKQLEYIRQDKLFNSDKAFFYSVPETESVIKKRQEVVDTLEKFSAVKN